MLVLDFPLEAVHLIHVVRLCIQRHPDSAAFSFLEIQQRPTVISSVQEYAIWVYVFQSKQRHDDLDTPATAIHKVSVEEERMFVRRHPCNFKDVDKIEELPMGVAKDAEIGEAIELYRHDKGGTMRLTL